MAGEYTSLREVEPSPQTPYAPILLPGALRPIDEPRREPTDVYMAGCPCLCVPKTSWATSIPCTGGFLIIGLGCRD